MFLSEKCWHFEEFKQKAVCKYLTPTENHFFKFVLQKKKLANIKMGKKAEIQVIWGETLF